MSSPDADRKTCGHTFYGKACAECRAANLTADLADARARLDKVRHDRDEMIRVHDEVEAERDALRGEIERTKAELAETNRLLERECSLSMNTTSAMLKAQSERDAAIAREQAAQAEAAEMRDALGSARIEIGRMATTGTRFSCSVVDSIEAAMDGTAGRAIAARVPLLEAVAKVARFWGLHDSELAKALAALDAKDGS